MISNGSLGTHGSIGSIGSVGNVAKFVGKAAKGGEWNHGVVLGESGKAATLPTFARAREYIQRAPFARSNLYARNELCMNRFAIIDAYSTEPDFRAVEQRLAACSRHANRVVCYIRAHFEWKGGWLSPGKQGVFNVLPAFRRHLRQMPEAPNEVAALAWDLLQTNYWRAYFILHDRELPPREEFYNFFFHRLVQPVPHREARQQSSVQESRIQEARVLRESRQLARRFRILRRDNYRCRLCGASASDGEQVRLEVDHITPRSKGGADDPSNLWTLCFACNRGKGGQSL